MPSPSSVHSASACANVYGRGSLPAMQSASSFAPLTLRRQPATLLSLGSQHCATMVAPPTAVWAESCTHVVAGNPPAPPSSACTGVNAAGELFVVEYGGNRVSHLSADGKLLGRFGSVGTGTNQFSTPWGIAVDSEGRVIVADTGNRRIVELKL